MRTGSPRVDLGIEQLGAAGSTTSRSKVTRIVVSTPSMLHVFPRVVEQRAERAHEAAADEVLRAGGPPSPAPKSIKVIVPYLRA
jgi:hypothetical protein